MGQRQPRHGAVVRGQTQKFLTLAAKSFVAGTSPPWTADTCCGRFSPRKVHSGKQAAGVAAEGQTTAPSGAVSLHTVRCAGSAGHGATEAARPERSLQAWFFRHRTVAAARNRASGFGGDWRVPCLFFIPDSDAVPARALSSSSLPACGTSPSSSRR
ncbi:Uncharacterised protein [Shigella sonnei]|nr:Uncharacterised protein [Shigella sonnei]